MPGPVTSGASTPALSAILCADWGKEFKKRSVYIADVTQRAIRRVDSRGWSFAEVIKEARRWSTKGPVLASFDVPLGVPQSYFSAAQSRWPDIEGLDHAEASEDDFDACVSAAALLRCVLDGSPLCPPQLDFPAIEGGILGTGSVNLQLRPRHFVLQGDVTHAVRPAVESPRQVRLVGVEHPDADAPRGVERFHRCPIAGCDKVFRGSRGGWDAHVASIRTHPERQPDLKEPETRKRRFEAEFPDFFNAR